VPEEAGNDKASALSTRIYMDLRALAAHYMQNERVGHTLHPTALVHEAWLRMVERSGDAENEQHFRALAARAMRNILIDHARRRGAAKRGAGWLQVTLDRSITEAAERQVDLIALDEAMKELGELNERKARVVEMRFFGGMSTAEAARALDIAPKTAEADWYHARAWLLSRLGEGTA
jgi:RNA polymerase sigma factor (TIGR02999 family)